MYRVQLWEGDGISTVYFSDTYPSHLVSMLVAILPPSQNDCPTPEIGGFYFQNVCPTNILEHKTLGGRTIILGRREYFILSN